ncbi:MAG: PstS family phosphate ABC transporter substrate-binding protein [Candidatus Bipolaricaulota bacterium]|nr:PstS family phosphate ABC transporter substrate-binding protein [Candidatus Bipolaricaulota bacterium]MCS7275329.1 PstS family phosphate ABC transporter substrate-binding protein [Candidatus Bipolaricaulota bacterium]MDW8110172.1 PstS family phosphate ABC transporter substrate-binding protein [Candidatus Bipolaricaulota bacterium]MDW8329204.1 PstS family phosphate ABC transporter substrate-binding protein [Candidatus Bipolaricaulota bacterium]
MKFSASLVRRVTLVALLVVGSVVLSSLAQPGAPRDSKNILADGSSTVAPITKAMAEEFKKVRPDANVTVGVSGTSAGFRRFVAGETDISNASRAIRQSEIETAPRNGVEYIELLIALDGLTVAVSNKTQIFGNAPVCLTVGELELLWARESEKFITKWNQVRSTLANADITLSGAASTSGTFDFFTSVVNGREGDSRQDYFGTEEDQLLAQQTGANPFALTYFGYNFFVHNTQLVQAVAIDPRRDLISAPADVLAEINKRREANKKPPLRNGGGECKGILPNTDTILAFTYQPLSRPLFIYVNKRSGERPLVDEFIRFYLDEARLGNQDFMLNKAGYMPVPRDVRDEARTCWSKRITGSAFGGQYAGLSLQQIRAKYGQHCK